MYEGDFYVPRGCSDEPNSEIDRDWRFALHSKRCSAVHSTPRRRVFGVRVPWVPCPLSTSSPRVPASPWHLSRSLFLRVSTFHPLWGPVPVPAPRRAALPVKVSAFHGHRDHARPTHSREICESAAGPISSEESVGVLLGCAPLGDSRNERNRPCAPPPPPPPLLWIEIQNGSLSYSRNDHLSDMCLAYLIARVRPSFSLVPHAIAVDAVLCTRGRVSERGWIARR